VTLKREAGGVGITDMLVIVLLADAAQNAMAGEYKSISDGLVLVSTIIFWSYALDWLGYRYGGRRQDQCDRAEPSPPPGTRSPGRNLTQKRTA
jgi:hypothetical protein